MIFSSPSNAPPQMNRMALDLTWMYACCGVVGPPVGGGHARRAHQQDIALVQLDFRLTPGVRVDALVVVVDRDGEGLLGALLPDHVLVQHVLDLGGRGDLGDRLSDLPLLVLGQDLVAQRDAFITDVDPRAGDEFPDRVLGLAAERAAEVLIVGHGAQTWEAAPAGASDQAFFLPPSISWRWAMTLSMRP